MVVYSKSTYKPLKDAFIREYRRVEPYRTITSDGDPKEPRRELTKNLNLREEYKKDLIKTYNNATVYLYSAFKNKQISLETKLEIQSIAVDNLAKLKESFFTLNLNYEFDKNIYSEIDISKIIENPIDDPTDSNSDSDKNSNIDTNTPNTTTVSIDSHLDSDKNSEISHTQNSFNETLGTQNQPTTMPQSKLDFLQACHAAIDYKYDGDPTGLDTFIDAIDLLSEVCETDNTSTLLKFIMTRLEGKAREAIMTTPKTVTEISTQLRNSIKTESSKVIQGKILALRAEKTNLTKFADRAEELSEQYRRSLIDEGFSKEKAKELSVEKTVELCIKQSRHDRLKSILASKTFSEPKDVIAKMIIEINNLNLDRQSSQNSSKNGNQNRFGKNFQQNRSSRSNGQNYNNNSSQNRGSNRSGQSNNSNNRSNGNGRSGQNNYSQGQSRTFTNNNFRRSNEQTVRTISGNQMNPGNGGEMNDN